MCGAADDDGSVQARAALKDLVFEGRGEGNGWRVWFDSAGCCVCFVLGARGDQGDCGDQAEGELQLHYCLPNCSLRGGHERKNTAERGYCDAETCEICHFRVFNLRKSIAISENNS